jgi:hypothetical protein
LTPTEFEKTPSKKRFASTCFRGPKPGPSAELRDPKLEINFHRSASPGSAGPKSPRLGKGK